MQHQVAASGELHAAMVYTPPDDEPNAATIAYRQDKTLFDDDLYAAELREEILGRESSLLSMVFCPEGRYLVAGSNTGRLAIWGVLPHLFPTQKPGTATPLPPPGPSGYARGESWRAPLREGELKTYPAHLVDGKGGYPLLSYQLSTRPLQSLVFAGEGSGVALCAGGEDGVWVLHWGLVRQALQEAEDALTAQREGGAYQGVRREVSPLAVLRAVGCSRRYPFLPECNMLAVQRDHPNTLYSACGDSVVRQWDLGALTPMGEALAPPPPASGQCMHAGQVTAVTSVGASRVVSGGEDGRVMLWDSRQGGGQAGPWVRTANAWISSKQQPSSSSSSSLDRGGGSQGPGGVWVGALDGHGEWVVAGGGVPHHARQHGFLSLLHLPSLSVVECCSPRAPVTDVKFNDDKITSVGLEGVVQQWSLSTLQKVGKAACTLPTLSALALRRQPNGLTTCAVAGGGNWVDYFLYPEHRTFSLTFR